MNGREQFLQFFRSVFIGMVERLETMTETQVLDGLMEVKVARSIYKEEFTERIKEMISAEPRERPRVAWAGRVTREELAYLGSIQAFFNSVNKLRSRTRAKAPPLGGPWFDLLEDALNERLESLRKRPSGDS